MSLCGGVGWQDVHISQGNKDVGSACIKSGIQLVVLVRLNTPSSASDYESCSSHLGHIFPSWLIVSWFIKTLR